MDEKIVKDCISRQAAIDAVLDRMNVEKYGRNAKPEEIQWALEKLPPAQPEKRTEERTEKHACDCISRQAAIDALRTHERKASKKWFDNQLDIEWNNAIDICCYDIEDLPPAQSEQRWIPCNEKDAEYPCIACDVFGQIFITDGGIVKINGECYDGTGFDFSNADEFLKGEKVGNAMRMLPRKIVAWLPMPEPYKEDDHD